VTSHRFSVVPAAYVYLLRGDEVLLQLRRNTGYMDGMWAAGAAGHVELGETAAATAVREAREELGIGIRAADLAPLTVMQRTDGTAAPIEQRVDWYFSASSWEGEPVVREPRKCAAIEWFPLSGLPEDIPPHERIVLEGLAGAGLEAFTSDGFALRA
jgi:8-oxo-dGTP pyrophosphatase MutT (NUDIX family)